MLSVGRLNYAKLAAKRLQAESCLSLEMAQTPGQKRCQQKRKAIMQKRKVAITSCQIGIQLAVAPVFVCRVRKPDTVPVLVIVMV